MSRNGLYAVLFVAAAALACTSGRARRASGPPAVLEVQNDANLDMTMYAVEQNGNRSRLGLATAHRTTFLTIPSRLIFGLTPLRFQADPIGAAAKPVTPEIIVEAGDTVVMRIPPSGNITIGRVASGAGAPAAARLIGSGRLPITPFDANRALH